MVAVNFVITLHTYEHKDLYVTSNIVYFMFLCAYSFHNVLIPFDLCLFVPYFLDIFYTCTKEHKSVIFYEIFII